jgi:prepilin peptidase CpaA
MGHTLGTQTIDVVPLAVALAVAVVAAVTDIRKGKVYNWLTAPAVVVGVGLTFLLSGPPGLKYSLFGIAVGLAVWFLQPLIGKPLGGGDVKLLIAVGALTGHLLLLRILLLSCVWAGLIAVVVAIARGKLWPCLKETLCHLFSSLAARTAGPLQSRAEGAKVPFAAATALGIVTTLVMLGTPSLT